MGVDLHRNYDSLDPVRQAARDDHEAMLLWAEQRCRELAAREQRGDYLQDGWSGWGGACQLGVLYGWRPAGTRLDEPGWTGGYFSNDAAQVTRDDALSLASALERALHDPDPERLSPDERIETVPADLRDYLRDAEDVREVVGRLAHASQRRCLESYVRFLSRGSFTIH